MLNTSLCLSRSSCLCAWLVTAGVSEAGFRFLLLDTYNQLWLLLRQYITSMERSE